MALEYTLSFKAKLDSEKKNEIGLIIEKHVNEDLFSIITYHKVNDYFSLDYKGSMFEEEVSDTVNINFRLNRSSDYENYIDIIKAMMVLVYELIEVTSEDFYFYFNGDVLHLKRENRRLEKDETSDFWKHL